MTSKISTLHAQAKRFSNRAVVSEYFLSSVVPEDLEERARQFSMV